MKRYLLASILAVAAGCAETALEEPLHQPAGKPAERPPAKAPEEPREDILVADFEGEDYGEWKKTGQAFGPGPARGTLGGQMQVSGYRGKKLVNTFLGGDGSTGTLTSPPVKLDRKYLAFLIGGGGYAKTTCINLLVEGKAVRTAVGPNTRSGGSEALDWEAWDVAEYAGKEAVIQIVDKRTGGWGHINIDDIRLVDRKPRTRPKVVAAPSPESIPPRAIYKEVYRPQFHFTAMKNWLNDPNGLVYYKGEYHLFLQHNPKGNRWGNMTWGHAVSTDMVHWKQLDHALHPDKNGVCFSGSAVVDWKNTAGFQTGDEKVIVAIYTSHGKGETQSLAYSNDKGRTWKKYAGNPVLKDRDRDPKVLWHEPTKKWVMTLFAKGGISFYSSPDLKKWTFMSNVKGFHECPDLFELAVDGDPGNTRWVLHGGSAGKYLIGRFDGTEFTPESGGLKFDYGRNIYAAQSFSDIPAEDGRRIQIGWMRGGKYPGMPFNQQMSIPCVLTLRTFPGEAGDGIRMCRYPVREIESVRGKHHAWTDVPIKEDENLLAGLKGDLFDIEAEIELGGATQVGFVIRGTTVSYDVGGKALRALGASAPLPAVDGAVKLRILVDRSSIEAFGNDGQVSMTSCFLPPLADKSLKLFADGGSAKVRSLNIWELKTIWPEIKEFPKWLGAAPPKPPPPPPQSREITLEKTYLLFPVKNRKKGGRISLVVDGKTVRELGIGLGTKDDVSFWTFLDLRPFGGKKATLKGTGVSAEAFDSIVQGDEVRGFENLYDEKFRPQFHFSSRRGWNNDPNGMVYYKGEWHLYYQHNPYGWKWGNMHWGHAVSRDLVQWTELPIALYPYRYNDWRYSGGGFVDWKNTAGWQTGDEKVIVAPHTSTGRGEVICYSNDRGRTFKEYEGNPVVKHRGRDPKIIWYEPGGHWVMAVFDQRDGSRGIAIYTSSDLKKWEYASRIAGYYECAEIFDLPVDGDEKNRKWVIFAADAKYALGRFDGKTFTPEHEGKHQVHWGNYYASQLFSDAPDGRRVQIGWGRGINMDGMPFNQMMTFPTELTLRTTGDGVRMFAKFVDEIALLHEKKHAWANLTVPPRAEGKEGAGFDTGVVAQLLDIRAVFEVGGAESFGVSVPGLDVTYDARGNTVSCGRLRAALKPVDGKVSLQILRDRASVEVCGNDGRVCLTTRALIPEELTPVRVFSKGGEAKLRSLEVYELRSAWRRK